MATRVYLPSSGSAPVTPSTFNFGDTINPLTFAGVLAKTSSAMTTKTEATGTVNPTARAMLRYVIGPLEAQSISGTLKGQMRASESNAGANATLAIAVKIIQPGGADRAVLIAQTASDSATATHEFATSLTNQKFENAAEAAAIPISTQSATRGDYLVIEIGFRSATGTTRNIELRYGDTGGTDLAEDTTTTTDNVPWVEFSGNLLFYEEPALGALTLAGLQPTLMQMIGRAMAVGALALAGLAPTVSVVNPHQSIAVPVGALAIAGTNVKVAFAGAETGALTLAGLAPTIRIGRDLSVSMVGHWPMDEAGANDDAIDVHGNNDLTMRNDGGSNAGQNPIDSTAARDVEFDSENALVGGTDKLAFTTDQDWTAIFRLTFESLNARNYLELFGKATASSYDFIAYWFNGVGFSLDQRYGSGSSNSVSESANPTLTLGATYVVACGHDSATDTIWVKVNGAARVTDAHTFGTRNTADSKLVAGDAGPTYFGTSHDGAGGPFTLWKRSLTDTEIDSWIAAKGSYASINPTGVQAIPAFLPAGSLSLSGLAPSVSIDAGTATSIAVPVGSLTLSGLAPALVFDIGRAIPAGALSLAGLAPVGSVALNTPVPAGSLTLAGLAPSAIQTLNLQVPAGTLTLSGLAPSLRFDFVLAVPAGSLSLAGLAPVGSLNLNTAIPAGALVLTGLAPSLSFNIRADLQAGALVLSGLTPSVSFDIGRAMPAGALVLSGAAATVSTDIGRAIPAGSLALVGLAPNVMTAFVIAVPSGSLTLTGRTPATGNQLNIEPSNAALTLVGLTPTLKTEFTIAVPAGSLALVGLAPTLPLTLPVPSAALTLTGSAPTLTQNQPIAIQVGSLTLTGLAPTVQVDAYRSPNAAALTLQGYAPNLQREFVLYPDAAALTLTGLAPTFVIAPTVILRPEDASLRVLGVRSTLRVLDARQTLYVLNPRHTIREL